MTAPASVKLHTLYRAHVPGQGLDTVATIERFTGERPYLLTTIADRVASSSTWFGTEAEALAHARERGFTEG